MAAPERTAVILLAAGLSSRFGRDDKLAEPLHDLPLGLHAARTAAAMPFAARIAIAGPRPLDFGGYGFTIIPNDDAAAGQARSIAIGVQQARGLDVDAVLIMLADMPFVSARHLAALLDGYEDRQSVIASATEAWSGPPALFGSAHFPALERLAGDRGAHDLIRQARRVTASPFELADIDTAEDLARYSSMTPDVMKATGG